MTTKAFIFFLICLAYSPVVFAGSGGVPGDINFDDKVGLQEAIHALQVLSGIKNGMPVFDSFQIYRADVIRELNRLAQNQRDFMVEHDTFSDDLEVITLESVLNPFSWRFEWPQINLEILSVKKYSFQIKATHLAVKEYQWTCELSVGLPCTQKFFTENGTPFQPNLEIFELHRGKVLEFLKGIFSKQTAFYAEYGHFSDNPELFQSCVPNVSMTSLESDGDSFHAEVETEKIAGYYWQIDSDGYIRTFLK